MVVRVSGTPSTRYSGAYGEPINGTRALGGTLGTEPTDYELKVEDSVSGSVSGAFRKTLPAEGTLKSTIVADGEVVAGREPSAESTWVPPAGPHEVRSLGEEPQRRTQRGYDPFPASLEQLVRSERRHLEPPKAANS